MTQILTPEQAMQMALEEAKKWEGATGANPSVAAVGLTEDSEFIALFTHPGPGNPHAEAQLIEHCKAQNLPLHTLVCTLEPCNHHGRTPPCSQAIVKAGVSCVFYGSSDPNPKAAGGHQTIENAGIFIQGGLLKDACDTFYAPFFKHCKTGLPWVTVKQALDENGSMIPPLGQKTFTSHQSLVFAHELRKKSDGILTTAATILADDPNFTVRLVNDHPRQEKRHLAILSRQTKVPTKWLKAKEKTFHIHQINTLEEALQVLGQAGCLRVLVEAGPTICQKLKVSNLWDEWVTIQKSEEDQINTELRTKPISK